MKRYHVTTFGCQMNAHDSERITVIRVSRSVEFAK
jgi:tRNA A37 methylthiotransferase MiaB